MHCPWNDIEQEKTKMFSLHLFSPALLVFLLLFFLLLTIFNVLNDLLSCFTKCARYCNGFATCFKKQKQKNKKKLYLYFWNTTALPGSMYSSFAVFIFPPQRQRSASIGTSTPQHFVVISALFLISRYHFVALSAVRSEQLNLCAHSRIPFVLLACNASLKFSAAVRLFVTFRRCGADIYAKWEFCRERTVVFTWRYSFCSCAYLYPGVG